MCKPSKISILVVIAVAVVFPLVSALAGGEVCDPCIAVTSNCSTNLVALCNSNAVAIQFSGTVSNCGDVTLTNVFLTDDLFGNGTSRTRQHQHDGSVHRCRGQTAA